MPKSNLLDQYFSARTNKRKLEIRNEIIVFYYEEGLIFIRSFLKTIDFHYNEAEDYLYVYLYSIDRALDSYDDQKSSFLVYLRNILKYELYREVGKDLHDNYALFNSLSLTEHIDDDEFNLNPILSDNGANCPRKNYEKNQLKVVLSDSIKKKRKMDKKEFNNSNLQKRILLLKYAGLTHDEISKILSLSINQIRYLLEDERDNTPLRKIKIIFSGKE